MSESCKESIFTGTNNFVSDTISSTRLNEYFGFTQREVDQILEDIRASAYAQEVKNGTMVIILDRWMYIVHGM